MTTHTIFGAGQIGQLLARELLARGDSVRIVRRGDPLPDLRGAQWLRGDAAEQSVADAACQGASLVYNCANPADYHRWDGVLQPLYRSIWSAAGRAGARLVQLDNLYSYGKPRAAPFDESTPAQPCSDKGRLRAELTKELLSAHQSGDVSATIGRASDFFGPGTVNSAVFRPDTYERISQGKAVYVLGDPDMPHSYSYTPDVARALIALGEHDKALGRVWHLPTAAHGTTRELIELMAEAHGSTARVRSIPDWTLNAAGLVVPLARAVAEMAYQWRVPYVMDDGAFRRAFAFEPTPLSDAIDETMGTVRRAA